MSVHEETAGTVEVVNEGLPAGGAAHGRSPPERYLQQREFLLHRDRRQGRDPDLQRRRRAHAGLYGRGRDEQDHAGRYFRSAGSDRARQGTQCRTGHANCTGL